MEEGTSRNIHRTLAEVIERDVAAVAGAPIAAIDLASSSRLSDGPAIPRIFDLAYHFDAGGEARKAWVYSLLGAEQARRQSALEVAAQQYAIARRNAGEISNAVRYRIAEGQGTALMFLGRYAEATLALEGADRLSDSPDEVARIQALRGELAHKQ